MTTNNIQRNMLKSKIHRATITDGNLDYEGSIAIDTDLLKAANIIPFEEVHIYNITNGNRFTTYAIEGEPSSGTICINGAAAHKASKGDLIIIATFSQMADADAQVHEPDLVYVDEKNVIKNIGHTIKAVI